MWYRPHSVEDAGASRRQLGGHRGQLDLEQLEQRLRDEPSGGSASLRRRVSGQAEHLGGDAVEEQRVAVLVAALQKEDPHHHAVQVLGGVGERSEVFGHGVLGDTEAGEQRRQAPATLVVERGPRARIAGQIDAVRVPLQAGHDLGVGREPWEHQQLGSISARNAEAARSHVGVASAHRQTRAGRFIVR